MKTDLFIYGAGGLGREVLSLISRDFAEEWNVKGFIDDLVRPDTVVDDLPVYTKTFLEERASQKGETFAVVFGLADPNTKKKIYNQIKDIDGITFPKIIAKTAILEKTAEIGEGTVISDNCWISTKVKIGCFCLLNVGNVVGHDTEIGDFSSFMPLSSISGFVKIGECALVGARSFILQGLTIGETCVVGAGCSIFSQLNSGETAITSLPQIIKTKVKKDYEE